MKKALQISGLLLVAFALVYCIQPSKTDKAIKPNVIFILADQWRAEAVGYAGNTDVKTPNIDRLASQSAVFKTAVSTMPVCTPYRGSLLTGQYPLKHGLFYNDKPLANEALTMGEIFKENGYRTGYIGKWHVNGHKNGEGAFSARDKPVPRNRRQGFDYWKVREVTHDYNNSFYFDENDRKLTWEGYDAFPQTDSAIGFIKKSKDPFLLVLSWGPPHNPYETAPEKYQKMYDRAKLKVRPNVPKEMQDSARKILAQYYAHCTALDDAMGKLMKTLDEQGIAENTIVVFTSDHGDMLLTRGVFRKQRPWDESILVPMLIRYPGKLGKKQIAVNKPFGTPDILPTLLGLSGIKIPGSVDGEDVSKGILSPEKYPIDAALIMLPVPFHEYNFSNGGREYRGVRTERYTYARKLNGPWLLYDNKTDPYQEKNLINKPECKDIQQQLEATLLKKLKETNDQFLPADAYMKLWNYNYDNRDSLRPQSYYTGLGK
ncbi:sulfatase [Dyadobacter sp. 32]|uniref:sulfatase family protein n=1 Tax=Dyadobacter sp. 32 TaxID=538966 RepID=UPI0011EDE780